jgi:hypothetical protein
MQIDGSLLTAHSWTLTGIIVLIAGILGGVGTFVLNALKSWETWLGIKNGRQKAPPAEPKPAAVGVAYDPDTLKRLRIPQPLKVPTGPSVRNVAMGLGVGATLTELAEAQSREAAAQHISHADAHEGLHAASDHASAAADAHHAVADHAHHWWDFFSNLFT